MQDKLFRKSLVIGIIILFVVISFIPSISGYFRKMNDIKVVGIETNNYIQTNERELQTTSTIDWWPMFGHDLYHSRHSTSIAPDSCNVKWIRKLGGHISSSPAVVDGKIYIGAQDDKLYCLNAVNGTTIWICQLYFLNVHWSSPAVADGKVYVGSYNNNIYCLNADDGTKIWSYKTGDKVCSSPAIADDKVYVGTYDDKVYCLDAGNGTMIWSYKTGFCISSSPAITNGKVYIGSMDFNVYCLDADDGSVIWTHQTSGEVISSPAIADDKVYVGTYNNNIYCLNADDGTKIWSYKTGGEVISSPAIADGKIYVGTYDDKVYCLDAYDGTKIWSYKTGGEVISSPAVSDDKVYVGSSGDGKVYCLDADDGTEIWSYQVARKNLGVYSSPAVADGKVYIGSDEDKVYCFGEPPHNRPMINGSTNGKPCKEYNYTFVTLESEGEDVYYYIEWGDQNIEEWIGPYSSGEEVILSHSWEKRGTFTIRAKTKDVYEVESDWGTLTVTMPRNKAITSPFQWFLQQHPNLFPILNRLLLQR